MILRHLNKLKLILKDWLSMLSVDWEFLENWKEKWLIIIEERFIQSKDLKKNEEWWLWESHFHSKIKKNLKDFNTIFYPKTHILIKFLIQASFIKKDAFDVALSCSKRLSGDLEAIQTLKSHENQKWMEINRKRKEKK